jgi:hypothetical protein
MIHLNVIGEVCKESMMHKINWAKYLHPVTNLDIRILQQ